MNGCLEKPCPCSAIVLAHKYAHGLVKHAHIIQASPACAFALEMNDGRASKIIIPVSRLLDPIAKVNTLPIQKEIFIKAAPFIQHFSSHHQVGTRQHIHFMVLAAVKISKMIAA